MHREWVSVSVGLGANVGEARQSPEAAVKASAKLPHSRVLNCSSFYRSAPVGATGPDYINAVLHLETRLNAYETLKAFQSLENMAGRVRPYRNAPRTLDIEWLLFGDARIQSPKRTEPHPRMRERAFVLKPLSELSPQRVSVQDLQSVQSQAIEKLDASSSDDL